MPTFNVRRSVVELIEANTLEDARRWLGILLREQGFNTYDEDDFEDFESETS